MWQMALSLLRLGVLKALERCKACHAPALREPGCDQCLAKQIGYEWKGATMPLDIVMVFLWNCVGEEVERG